MLKELLKKIDSLVIEVSEEDDYVSGYNNALADVKDVIGDGVYELKNYITAQDFATLCICAIRYCHGRQSYMPRLVQEIVGNYLDNISDNDLKIMLNDCDFQKEFNLYGNEKIDKPNWIRWKEKLEEEQRRRAE